MIRVKRGAGCGTDHCFVESKIYIPYRWKMQIQEQETSETFGPRIIRYDLNSAEQESTKYLYQQRLKQKLIAGKMNRATQEKYQFNEKCIKETAGEALGTVGRSNRSSGGIKTSK